MEFSLNEELLRLKECSGENVDGITLDNAQSLDDIIDALEENTDAIQEYSLFNSLKSFVLNFESLDAFNQNKVVDLLMNALKNLLRHTQNSFDMGELPATLKQSWELTVFLSYWLSLVTERKHTAKTGTITAAPVKKKKSKQASQDDNQFDWDSKKLSILELYNEILQLPLIKIWSLMHERAPFIGLFVDTANLILETESNLKDVSLKQNIVKLLSTCVLNYDHAQGFQTVVMQNLRYSTHLAEFMAELLTDILSSAENQVPNLLSDLFHEIGNIEFSNDDKTAKEFSKFLVSFGTASPRLTFRNFSYLIDLIDSDSYLIRIAVVEVLSSLMAHIASTDSDEATRNQANTFCQILEERIMDISSYVRARVLKAFYTLTEVPVEGTGEQACTRNAIPLSRRISVLEVSAGRLNDKTAAVRKDALRVLTKFVETHPFWLDGGILDLKVLEDKKAHFAKILESAVPNDDFIQDLANALPHEAKLAMQQDGMMEGIEVNMEQPKALSEEEIEDAKRKFQYYSDAVKFTKVVLGSIPTVTELLLSKTKSDVIEAIAFFVEAHIHGVSQAYVGIKSMVHLVWSKDTSDNESKSIREYLLQAYTQLYFSVNAETEKDRAKKIVKNLITLTFDSNLADLTSIEQLLSIMMARDMIPESVVQHLWSVYGASVDIPCEQRRGAIILIGMLAKDSPETLIEKIPILVKIGFGQYGREDLFIARYTCIALQKLGIRKKSRKNDSFAYERYPNDHLIFSKLRRAITERSNTMSWFYFCEQGINLIFALSHTPELLCDNILRRLTYRVFPQLKSPEQPEAASQPTESQEPLSQPQAPTAMELAQLLFVIGHVAIKEIAHLEEVESNLKNEEAKKRQEEKDSKTGKSASNSELDQVVGNCEDDIADRMHFIRENELLFGRSSMLSFFVNLVVTLCQSGICASPLVRRMAILSLCKLMCVSERFCEENLSLLLGLLRESKDSSTRSNIIVGIGDMAVCYNNLIDHNITHLYKRLQDPDLEVKKNALMVLTHLVLNGMVKVKGQLSEMALCIEDPNERIRDLAKMFFTELATKENAIYNNLTDMISNLSAKGDDLDPAKFQNIMKFLFAFIDKDRQTENIIEKLCGRFKDAESVRLWHDLAYCISLLQIKSERALKKLAESLPTYQDKLHDDAVFTCFLDIINKSRKLQKAEMKMFLDDFETSLSKAHESGRAEAEVLNNATSASQAFNQWDSLKPSNAVEEANAALENLKISGTPVKKKTQRQPKKKVVKKKVTRRKYAEESDEEMSVDENYETGKNISV